MKLGGAHIHSRKKSTLLNSLSPNIGKKRTLLDFIGNGMKKAQEKLCKNKLKTFDAFSGSGIVARHFKKFSGLLITNDLKRYSALINECYLS